MSLKIHFDPYKELQSRRVLILELAACLDKLQAMMSVENKLERTVPANEAEPKATILAMNDALVVEARALLRKVRLRNLG